MRREETVDYHIKAAWHSIARMYNQQALQYDATMSMGNLVVYQKYYSAIMKGYALSFIVTYSAPADLGQLQSLLSSIAFAR